VIIALFDQIVPPHPGVHLPTYYQHPSSFALTVLPLTLEYLVIRTSEFTMSLFPVLIVPPFEGRFVCPFVYPKAMLFAIFKVALVNLPIFVFYNALGAGHLIV
jgi:hypothetical protein